MKPMNNARILMTIACVALLPSCAKTPESTVESFYEAIASGEITEAKGYLSAQIIGMMGDVKLSAALSSETEKIQKCGGIKNVEVDMQGEGEVRSGTATVNFNGECRSKVEKTKLVKEDGNWKITASK